MKKDLPDWVARKLPKPYYREHGCAIYHADCREILPQLEAGTIDLIFTDPPYGHNNNNGDLIANREKALGRGIPGEARPILNDGPEETRLLVEWFWPEANRLLAPGCCCCCCCCGGGPDPQFARWTMGLDEAIGFKQAIVWDKGGLGMGWHYRRNYEFILVAEKPGAACRWYGGNKEANVIRFPKIIPQKNDHPTPKPIELPLHFLRLHSRERDLILDPFLGGGTTMTAAKLMHRHCIGIEIEEKYCKMAADQLAQGVLNLPPA